MTLVLIVPISGCSYTVEEVYELEMPLGDTSGQPSYTPYEPPANEPVIPTAPSVAEPVELVNSPITVDDQQPPDNVTWISPGKVIIGNFHKGAKAEYPIAIHNGEDTSIEFLVYYRQANRAADGYIIAPDTMQDRVTIADPTPVLAPKETRNVIVVLEMPDEAEPPSSRWEFWIAVKDNSQNEMIQTELCSRWLVEMRVD